VDEAIELVVMGAAAVEAICLYKNHVIFLVWCIVSPFRAYTYLANLLLSIHLTVCTNIEVAIN
jgi:hypothetical protein